MNLRCKQLTADILFPLVKEKKMTYAVVKAIDPKKFEDLQKKRAEIIAGLERAEALWMAAQERLDAARAG